MCDIIRNAMGKYLKRLGIILLAAAFSLFLISGPVFAVPSDNDTNPTPDTSKKNKPKKRIKNKLPVMTKLVVLAGLSAQELLSLPISSMALMVF